MSRAAVDTSFAIALMDEKDRHHERALRILDGIEKAGLEVIYIDCVINEIYSVIARRFAERKMSERFPEMADKITSSLEDVEIINAYQYLPKAHPQVVGLMKRTEGRLSYHDALIALSLKEEGVGKIISLDVDFDEVFYLTDTGRRWDGSSVSVRDKVSGQLKKRRDGILSPGMNRMNRMETLRFWDEWTEVGSQGAVSFTKLHIHSVPGLSYLLLSRCFGLLPIAQ